MYGCESWTIKKAEHQRMDAFELWCWRRVLRVPLDCKEVQPVHPKGDQSSVFTGRTDVEAETPILWPPDVKSWLICKDPDAGKDWGLEEKGDDRGWDGWMASPTQWTWVWVDSGSWWWTGRPGVLQFTGSQRAGHDWVTELNWTEGLHLQCRRRRRRRRHRFDPSVRKIPWNKKMATYLSILAWKIQVHGVTKDSATSGQITVEAWELRVSHDEKQTKYTYCPVHQWPKKSN